MATPPPSKNFVQDLPPPGGYPSVKTVRNNPVTRGPPGWVLWSGLALMTVYGFIKVGEGNRHRRALKKEKRECRIALLPFLQAEQDVLYLKQQAVMFKDEAQVMKDVPGWKVGESVYHTKKAWTPI